MNNVAIIGLGNISVLYDYNKNDKDTASSHLKAIYLHEKFDLKYIADIDDSNVEKVRDLFPKVNYYKNYEDLRKFNDIDILVIAVPTILHFKILSFFKYSNIKIFFMEKPLFYKAEEYNNLDTFFKDRILVNYIRRFQEPFQNLKKNIESNSLKNIQKINLTYVKGFKNNGTHFIDIINFLFNNPKIISSTILDENIGFDKSDLSYDIFMKILYKNQIIPIYFIALDHRKYNIIEMKLYFENKVVEYINSKQTVSYFNINESKEYVGYNFIDEHPIKKETLSKKLIYHVYNHIDKTLMNREINLSSFRDEQQNFNVIKKIIENK